MNKSVIKEKITNLTTKQYSSVLIMINVFSFIVLSIFIGDLLTSCALSLISMYIAHKVFGRIEFGNWR